MDKNLSFRISQCSSFMTFFSSAKLILLWLLTLPLIHFSQEQRTVLLTTVGAGTWTVPCGVTSIKVEAWGGGGGGGYRQMAGSTTGYGSAGGGGGAYEVSTFSVIPSETLTVEIGKGGSGGTDGTAGGGTWTNVKNGTGTLVKRGNSILISAAGGHGALDNTVENGGTYGAGGVKTTAGGRSGGKGGKAGKKGGGGGGAGYPGGAGGNGGDGTGGTSSLENKLGGAGGLGGQDLNKTSGSTGYAFGGGGGGSLKFTTTTTASDSPKGGAGANGGIIITYTLPKGYVYCQKSFSSVRPITNVTFAGINPTTPATSTAQNLEFCAPGSVRAGGIYPISIRGNTGGDNADFITVFIDWDGSGNLNDNSAKVYRLGTIRNSTGADGKSLTGIIRVPADAKVGLTKVRVVKNNANDTQSCTDATPGIGQSQDFWINVEAAQTCPASVAAPANLVLQQSGNNINGSFAAATLPVSGYVILRSASATAPTPSLDMRYVSGTTVGDYYVLRGIDIAGNATTFVDPAVSGHFFYHVMAYNAVCTDGPVYSTALTGTINLCNPQSTGSARYISSVKFTGTLIPDRGNSSVYTSSGYHDYRGTTAFAEQLPGGIVNMNVRIVTPEGATKSTTKVWVDWNRDGIFSEAEKMYDNATNSGFSANVLFGFKVPTNVATGLHTVRVRTSGDDASFGPCGTLADGETEDYHINIVADCPTKIDSATAIQTGPGTAAITINPAEQVRFLTYEVYDTEFGPLSKSSSKNVFTFESLLPGVHQFYVRIKTNTCETSYRMPVTVIIKPVPQVTFTPNDGDVCGEASGIAVMASVGKEQVTLLDDSFSNTPEQPQQFVATTAGHAAAASAWQLRTGPFTPSANEYSSVRPILTSGDKNGQFMNIITDVRQKRNILNHLTTIPTFNTVGFTDLKIDYNLYYFSQQQQADRSYLELQYSLDAGASWQMLKRYTQDTGAPSRFVQESLTLPANLQNQTQLKFRFTAFAFGNETEYAASIAGIDNVRFYGNRDIPQQFTWNGGSGVVFDSDCVSPPTTGQNICIRPTAADLLTKTSITLRAGAQVSSGTSVEGTFVIRNQNRLRDTAGSGEWSETLWKPGNIAPTEDHCVVVQTPLRLLNVDGAARRLTVENGGSITIAPHRSLIVAEDIINNAAAKDFVVESDANLLQRDDAAVNVGAITVKRNSYMKRLDYTYWGSPVQNQNLKAFSPGTLDNRFSVYNEATDFFDAIAPSNNFVPAKGYAIRSPNNFPTDNLTYRTFNGAFVGVPNNGTVTGTAPLVFPLKKQGRGFNLISNPYPSNIDFGALVALNSGRLRNIAYFWTNINTTPAMQGSNYPNGGYVNNYAILNGSGTTPATYSVSEVNPNPGALFESLTPTGFLRPGQGFIIQSHVEGEDLVFNNSIRTTNDNSVFFNREQKTEKDRYWLQLTTPLKVVTTTLVAYVEGATDGYDADYDASLMGLGSDALFTPQGERRLAIQGRQYPLKVTDVVPLGTNHHAAGQYQLSIALREGIFATGQTVYLKDKEAGTYVSLSEKPYVFSAPQGITEGRFELRYEPEMILSTGTAAQKRLVVYRNGDDFVVKSDKVLLKHIEVYDAGGRLLAQLSPNSLQISIPAAAFPQGLYVLKIQHGQEIVTRKVIK